MKICFNETLDTSSLMTDLELCEKYGYDYIEIRLAYLQDYLKDHPMKDLKEYFNTHHIKPFGYNSITDVNFCTPEKWKEVKEFFTFACKAVKEIGGKSIVVVPTCSEEMRNKTEKEVFDDSVKVLKELSDIAKPYGAMISWEPIGHPVFACNSTAEGMAIVNAVNRDNVGITVDAFNMYAYNAFEDIEDIRKIPKEKIVVFHINDAMNIPFDELDTLKHRAYPGEGKIQLDELCAILKDIGYDDVASLELFGDWMYEDEPEALIRDGYRKTTEYLKKVGLI